MSEFYLKFKNSDFLFQNCLQFVFTFFTRQFQYYVKHVVCFYFFNMFTCFCSFSSENDYNQSVKDFYLFLMFLVTNSKEQH